MGCCLWGRTELDMTEQQQQQEPAAAAAAAAPRDRKSIRHKEKIVTLSNEGCSPDLLW